MTAGGKQQTVTVTTPTDPGTTPAPKPTVNHSVLGTWGGMVVNQSNKAGKFRISVIVKTTRVDIETVGSASIDGGGCYYPITAGGQQANAFKFSSNKDNTEPFCATNLEFSLERKTDNTVVIKTDWYSGDYVGTLHRG